GCCGYARRCGEGGSRWRFGQSFLNDISSIRICMHFDGFALIRAEVRTVRNGCATVGPGAIEKLDAEVLVVSQPLRDSFVDGGGEALGHFLVRCLCWIAGVCLSLAQCGGERLRRGCAGRLRAWSCAGAEDRGRRGRTE